MRKTEPLFTRFEKKQANRGFSFAERNPDLQEIIISAKKLRDFIGNLAYNGVMMMNVLFVCTGNICRSAMAEAIFKDLIAESGVREKFNVDSCGISSAHEGQEADERTRDVLKRNGVRTPTSKARGLQTRSDFDIFQYLIAMDRGHLSVLRRTGGEKHAHQLYQFLDIHDGEKGQDVPDPYYGTIAGFNRCYEMIAKGCEAWLNMLIRLAK